MKRIIKNVLITGGSGFIGTNFIKIILKQNLELNIYNIDKLTYASNNKNHEASLRLPNYNFIQGDICDRDLLDEVIKKNSIDCVVHFAAESHVDRSIEGPEEFLNTNILGTFNLLQASLKQYKLTNNFLFLHVSTDEVYGSLEIEEPSFTEKNQYLPNSPYSASKASSDMLVRSWHHTFNLPTLTTNCSNNYGPYQFPEKLIPLTILNAISNKPITIYGDGKNIRDWLYVDDHCTGILKVLESGELGEVYNIGGNNEYKNIEIVWEICDILDILLPINTEDSKISSYKDLITYVTDRPGHDFRYSVDSSKLKNSLNWVPQTSFNKGIRQTVEWYLKNPEWIKSVINKK
tara:strand:- start:473 stop:1516 length:1044 start_codon:yes stop_codon:yes gene_type:complete